MEKNRIAQTLQFIGVIELIAAFVVTLTFDKDYRWLGTGIIVGSFITCMIFQGFAEIIELLCENVKKQDMIIEILTARSKMGNNAPNAIIRDIEANLPEL